MSGTNPVGLLQAPARASAPHPNPLPTEEWGEGIQLPRHPPFQLAQQAPPLGQLLQQPGWSPARPVALVPGRDLVVDLARPDAVGPEHQAAAIAREAEAVEPHHVDVAGAQRLALLQDPAGLVDRGEQQSAQDLLVAERALLD